MREFLVFAVGEPTQTIARLFGPSPRRLGLIDLDRTKVRHERALHRHKAELEESLGEPMARQAILYAERAAPAGAVDVGEIEAALRSLRVPNLGQISDHLAPPVHRRKC